MKVNTLIGVLLIALGVFVLAAGRVSYHTKDEVAHVGPVEISKGERKTIPLSPVLGGLVLAGGVALMVVSSRK